VQLPDLGGQGGGPGELAAPFECGVEVSGLDDGEAADVLLALGVRAVGDEHAVALGPHHGGGARRLQARGEDPRARGLEFPLPGADAVHHLAQDLGWRGRAVGLVDAEQVAVHRDLLSPSTRTAPGQIDSGGKPARGLSGYTDRSSGDGPGAPLSTAVMPHVTDPYPWAGRPRA